MSNSHKIAKNLATSFPDQRIEPFLGAERKRLSLYCKGDTFLRIFDAFVKKSICDNQLRASAIFGIGD